MRIVRSLTVTLVLVAALGLQNVNAQNPGTVTELGTLGGTRSLPVGINDLGDVVGVSTVPGDSTDHAFFWTAGQMNDLGTLPGHLSSRGEDINNLRQIVGVSIQPPPTNIFTGYHAFLWENGVMTDLNTAATAAAGWWLRWAFGINDAGQIVGQGMLNGVSRAYILDQGIVTALDTLGGAGGWAASINRFGQAVGVEVTPDGRWHASQWSNGSITDLGPPASPFSFASEINDFGDAIGWFQLGPLGTSRYPILWSNGTALVLSTLGDPSSSATGINNVGQIVGAGTSLLGSPGLRAILWENGSAIDVETLIAPGYDLVSAADINDAGQVIGTFASGRGFLIQLPVSASGAVALIEALVDDAGVEASLLAKINGAAGSPVAECNQLRAAANEIQAQAGKKIPADVAATLLQNIQVALAACP